jgi:hypothetical protein
MAKPPEKGSAEYSDIPLRAAQFATQINELDSKMIFSFAHKRISKRQGVGRPCKILKMQNSAHL